VSGKNVLELVLIFIERIVNVEYLSARITEDNVALLLYKSSYDNICS
jgi:hypothetical protein